MCPEVPGHEGVGNSSADDQQKGQRRDAAHGGKAAPTTTSTLQAEGVLGRFSKSILLKKVFIEFCVLHNGNYWFRYS